METAPRLDQWLSVPMALLSLAWLLIVVWELVSGSTELLTTVGTAIWIVFIVEFLIRKLVLKEVRALRAQLAPKA